MSVKSPVPGKFFIRAASIFALAVLTAVFCAEADAQRTLRKVKLAPKDARKMSTVKLEAKGRQFSKFMLYRTSRSEMTLLKPGTSDMTAQGYYMPFKVDIDDFDKITIYNRKRKIKYSVIGGVGLAAAGYFVTDQIFDNKLDNPTLELLGQETSHRFVEPIAAAIIGAAVGVIVGELLAPVRIDVKKDKQEAYKKLRQFSYR